MSGARRSAVLPKTVAGMRMGVQHLREVIQAEKGRAADHRAAAPKGDSTYHRSHAGHHENDAKDDTKELKDREKDLKKAVKEREKADKK